MPRIALGLVVVGLLAILLTLVLVLGEATLPGRLPPVLAALLAAFGGLSLVGGLFLIESKDRSPQSLSG